MKLVLLATALLGSILCFTGLTPFGAKTAEEPQSVQTLWYPSGQARCRAELEAGVREGPAIEWYADGQERCSGEYLRGLRDGPWVFYTQDGAIDWERSGTYLAGLRAGP